MLQADLFEKDTALVLMQELKKTRDITENVRRGLFARYNELERMVLEIKYKMDLNDEKCSAQT
jgi:hypothetical protein